MPVTVAKKYSCASSVRAMFAALPEAVLLARISDVCTRNSRTLQGREHHLRLVRRDHRVIETLEQQHCTTRLIK